MKKIIFVSLISLFLIFGIPLFAAGQKEEATVKPVELDFPSWQAEEAGFADFWQVLIQEFEAQHVNVKVNLSQIPYKQYMDTLTTRFAAGSPPDILHLPARNTAQIAAQGWLESLDSRLKKTDIPKNWTPLQVSMVYKGETKGILLMGYGYIFYYNEKLLQDAGLSMPKTLEELLSSAKALTKEEEGIFGYGLTTTEHPNVYVDVASFVYGQGLSFFKNGEYNFTDSKVVKAVELYREISQYAPKGTTTEMKRQLFIDGKIAMIVDGPWVIAMLNKASETVKPHLKIAVTPYPRNPGGPSNSLHIPSALSPEKKDLVWEFIKLAATPELQAKYTILTKSPAGRKGVLTAEMKKEYPELEIVNIAAAGAVNTLPESENCLANYSLYRKTIAKAMTELLLADTPTATVLEDLQKELYREVKP